MDYPDYPIGIRYTPGYNTGPTSVYGRKTHLNDRQAKPKPLSTPPNTPMFRMRPIRWIRMGRRRATGDGKSSFQQTRTLRTEQRASLRTEQEATNVAPGLTTSNKEATNGTKAPSSGCQISPNDGKIEVFTLADPAGVARVNGGHRHPRSEREQR